MGKEKIYFYKSKIRYFMPLFALCVSLVIFSGCSKGEKESTKANDGGKQASQKTEKAVGGGDKQTLQDEDMVSSPIDFEQLDTISKEENGISYYNFHSTKEMPLPLNEWAKLDIASKKGAIVPAYIRFTSVTRDIDKLEKHMDQYFKVSGIKSTFSPQPEISSDEYVLMKYDVLVGKDASLDKGDSVPLLSIRFPLQLFSTMRSGEFGDGTAQERENFVRDASVLNADMPLDAGTLVEKAVLCSVPKNYTAYGIMVPYVNAGGTTQSLCFKLEY